MARMAPSRQGDMDGPQDKLGYWGKNSNIEEKSKKPRKSSLGAGQPFRADYSSSSAIPGLLTPIMGQKTPPPQKSTNAFKICYVTI